MKFATFKHRLWSSPQNGVWWTNMAMETWTLSKKIYSLRRNGPRKIFTFQFFNLYLARYSDSCRRRLLVGGPPQMVVLVTKGSVTPKNAHEKSWKIDGETNPSLKWTSRTWTLEGKKTIFSFWDGPYFECNPHIGWLGISSPIYPKQPGPLSWGANQWDLRHVVFDEGTHRTTSSCHFEDKRREDGMSVESVVKGWISWWNGGRNPKKMVVSMIYYPKINVCRYWWSRGFLHF